VLIGYWRSRRAVGVRSWSASYGPGMMPSIGRSPTPEASNFQLIGTVPPLAGRCCARGLGRSATPATGAGSDLLTKMASYGNKHLEGPNP
jgi:hypothetical protein